MVQCLRALYQIGALKFVTLRCSTPEMSRMTAFLRCPRAAARPILQRHIHVHENNDRQNGSDTRSWKQAFQTSLFFVDDEGLRLRSLTSLCFFLFWPMDHCKRLVPIATNVDGPSELDLAYARKSSFHSSFRRSLKCFAQPGNHHTCQARNTGSALKKKDIFKKYSHGRRLSSQKKCLVTGRNFQKELQDIVETKSPRA